MAISALGPRWPDLLDRFDPPIAATTGATVGASLVAMGLGVRLPQWAAVWATAGALRRLRRWKGAVPFGETSLVTLAADRSLYWLVQSLLALAAGILTSLLPLQLRLADGFHAWMHRHFVWSVGPLAILQAGIIVATVAPACAMLGLCVSASHHLSSPSARWNTRATGWLLAGATIGLLIASSVGDAHPDAIILRVAGVPVLIASLVCVAASTAAGRAPLPSVSDSDPTLPLYSDRRPRLLRTGIVCVGGSAACAMTVWLHSVTDSATHAAPFAALMLAATSVGIFIGFHESPVGDRSIGGFGTRCVSAGAVAALVAVVFGGGRSMGPGAATALGCLTLLPIGIAATYGREMLLERVAGPAFTGAKVLGRTLTWAGLTVWIAVPVAEGLLGRLATLALLSLSLLVLGGLLIIHEPGYSTGTRRRRLSAVFGTIAVMILVFRFGR